MSDDACSTLVRNVWDDVPDPGPCPPLPKDDPPAPGSPGRAEHDRMMRDYRAWLRAYRRRLLAESLARLASPLSPGEKIDEIGIAVRVLGTMVLAGEVGPGPLATLLDLF